MHNRAILTTHISFVKLPDKFLFKLDIQTCVSSCWVNLILGWCGIRCRCWLSFSHSECVQSIIVHLLKTISFYSPEAVKQLHIFWCRPSLYINCLNYWNNINICDTQGLYGVSASIIKVLHFFLGGGGGGGDFPPLIGLPPACFSICFFCFRAPFFL
jgi:hypothetical protein